MRFSVYFALGAGLLSAGALVASPAYAAPIEQISCAHDQLTPDQIRQMVEIVSIMIEERPIPSRSAADESEKWIDAALANCAARYGWNDAERENAKQYSAFMLFHRGFTLDPMLAGVNFSALEAYAAKLRPDGDDSQLTTAEKKAIRAQVIQSGVDATNERAMKKAVFFVSAAFRILGAKAAFAAGKRARPLISDLGD